MFNKDIEKLNFIVENISNIEEIIKRHDDIKGAYEVRNFIAHDYMGVDIGLIEYILRDKLPELKNSLISIILEK
ncbi:DUF86 domain-containing protein [Arcobacter cryaerophilus gv. pseudocryaerophilus]|uniref:DUF86 domain-containing protein n=3 Tax=unclassified Arcobacter TaxID=2593671 RepID=A0AA96RCK0_9BACT|nr:DUF86 domain-containing protein [Arcobacter sp. AZ-2023]WPD06193.1 DUF86 domain-containing protein [Arcobacter sp. DSM 115956]WPD08284.1 DUF86 domain-containing protein [Arcobacter sp. DSM 115955]WNL32549.1 DUF86 domain-containing protein [Arcobacter sp. AZ-2023]WNP38699.1 DUF86 domain-containing protein [Arcobacter sp. AZ-2023]